MRSVKNDIFVGLVRNPPTTVGLFVAKATNVERALWVRPIHYDRLVETLVAVTLASPQFDQGDVGADNL